MNISGPFISYIYTIAYNILIYNYVLPSAARRDLVLSPEVNFFTDSAWGPDKADLHGVRNTG